MNELCVAKYGEDQKWYRGRCLELVGDGFPTIVFFDYGNIAAVDIENIRVYPLKFSFPVFTADCEINGKSICLLKHFKDYKGNIHIIQTCQRN